jgi:beta-exotoxin I transport system permease protein
MLLRSILSKTVRDHWRALIGWSLGLALLSVFELAVYPSVRDRAADMERLIAAYPEALKAMFGLSDFTSGAGFINAELFSLMVPLLLLALGIAFGAAATAGEEERKTIDLLLANPIPRRRVVVEKLVAIIAVLAVLAGIAWATLSVGAAVLDMGVGPGALAAVTASALLLGICFATVAVAVGAATGRRAVAAAVASALAAGAYLLNALSPLVAGLKPWRWASLFYHYIGYDPLRQGLALDHVLVLVGVGVLMTAVAAVAFERRDLRV